MYEQKQVQYHLILSVNFPHVQQLQRRWVLGVFDVFCDNLKKRVVVRKKN